MWNFAGNGRKEDIKTCDWDGYVQSRYQYMGTLRLYYHITGNLLKVIYLGIRTQQMLADLGANWCCISSINTKLKAKQNNNNKNQEVDSHEMLNRLESCEFVK